MEDISPLAEWTEAVNVDDPKHRWTMIPDGSGRMHLVDLNPMHIEEPEKFWSENDVFFLLYTPRNPTNGQRITVDANAVRNSNFNAGAPVRFLFHGWNNDHQSDINTAITSAYLSRGEFNVVSSLDKNLSETNLKIKLF